jgi:hypothetical protein
MGRHITPNPSDKLELPFDDHVTVDVPKQFTAIVSPKTASMSVPGFYEGIYNMPSIGVPGGFRVISTEDFQRIMENCRPYTAYPSGNIFGPKVMIQLRDYWRGHLTVHMFPAVTN